MLIMRIFLKFINKLEMIIFLILMIWIKEQLYIYGMIKILFHAITFLINIMRYWKILNHKQEIKDLIFHNNQLIFYLIMIYLCMRWNFIKNTFKNFLIFLMNKN